jgi:hypothetical protein
MHIVSTAPTLDGLTKMDEEKRVDLSYMGIN